MGNTSRQDTGIPGFIGTSTDFREGDIVVFAIPTCGHCRGSKLANNDITETSNGTRVRWVSYIEMTAEQRKALGLTEKDISYNGQTFTGSAGVIKVDGQDQDTTIQGMPFAVRVTGRNPDGSWKLEKLANSDALVQPGAYEALSHEPPPPNNALPVNQILPTPAHTPPGQDPVPGTVEDYVGRAQLLINAEQAQRQAANLVGKHNDVALNTSDGGAATYLRATGGGRALA